MCGDELIVGGNWTERQAKANRKLCKPCKAEKQRDYHRRTRKVRVEWARDYRAKNGALPGNGKLGRPREINLPPVSPPKGDGPGFIYALTHPKFPGWTKVGHTTHPDNRLSSYQTGCPFNGYQYAFCTEVPLRRSLERELLSFLWHHRPADKSEWVQMHHTDIEVIFNGILEKQQETIN